MMPTPRLVTICAATLGRNCRAPARLALLPHDPHTGEEIERDEVVKGYEYERGQFVTFTADELKALDVESSKIIDLETFVPRAEVDPVYFSTPYYVYPPKTFRPLNGPENRKQGYFQSRIPQMKSRF